MRIAKVFGVLASLGLFNFSLYAVEIDIPLSVTETAGVERNQYPITSGVPLPRGALKSTEKLQILDKQGKFIPAQFWVANRWWEDGSIKWLQFDFAAKVPPHSQTTYYLREIGRIPEFPSPIGILPRGQDFEVITGPLRFVIGGKSNALLDQVWVDENWGYDFSERTKILESGNFDLVLTGDNRTYQTDPSNKAKIHVEEANALRAVIRISGRFVLEDQKETGLDYIARITVYGGKTYFKLEFTVMNRGTPSGKDFVILDELSLRLGLNLTQEGQKFAFGGAQEEHQGDFVNSAFASLYQEKSDRYILSGAAQGSGAGKSVKPMNLGWADLSDDWHGLSVANRWFWQLFPKAYEVRSDGSIIISLFPKQASPQKVFTGMAKTHEMLFYFHGKRDFASGQVKSVLLGFQKPVYAVAPARWYCSDTGALGHMTESSESAYRPEYWGIVQKYDEWLVRSRDASVARRDQPGLLGDQGSDGYGIFRFGGPTAPSIKKPWSQSLSCLDFPHALYLHFFRTGDLKSLETAEEGLSFLKDQIAYHSDVSAHRLRIDRLVLSREEEVFGVGALLNSRPDSAGCYPNAGLFDSFLLTGNRRSLEAGHLLSEHALGSDLLSLAPRASVIGDTLLGLLRGYEVFGDRRYVERAEWIVNTVHAWQDADLARLQQLHPRLAESWEDRYKNGYGSEAWTYGIAWEALKEFSEITGRKDIPEYMQRAAEWIYGNSQEWQAEEKQYLRYPNLAIGLAAGLASVYQSTGSRKYWDLALEAFRTPAEHAKPVDDLGSLALYFGSSQRFLWFLSKESEALRKREVSIHFGEPRAPLQWVSNK